MQIIINAFKTNFAVCGACQAPHCFESHRKITQGKLDTDQGPHTSSGKQEKSVGRCISLFLLQERILVQYHIIHA